MRSPVEGPSYYHRLESKLSKERSRCIILVHLRNLTTTKRSASTAARNLIQLSLEGSR